MRRSWRLIPSRPALLVGLSVGAVLAQLSAADVPRYRSLGATTASAVAQPLPTVVVPARYRTVFATERHASTAGDVLWRLRLDRTGKAVSRTPMHIGVNGVATDTADGRAVFVRRDVAPRGMIWIREANGQSRPLTEGRNAIFTPDRQALLVERWIPPGPDDHLEDPGTGLYLYDLAAGTIRHLVSKRESRTFDYRVSFDGRRVWRIWALFDAGSYLEEYDLRRRKVIRTLAMDADNCTDLEMLPSGRRIALLCEEYRNHRSGVLKVVRFSDLRITSPRVRSSGLEMYRLHGRLNTGTLLVSVSDARGQNSLGALDLNTMTVRRLPNTLGLSSGVAPY
jgi:hypothetical protein